MKASCNSHIQTEEKVFSVATFESLEAISFQRVKKQEAVIQRCSVKKA